MIVLTRGWFLLGFFLFVYTSALNAQNLSSDTLARLLTEIKSGNTNSTTKRYELAKLLVANGEYSEALYHLKSALQEIGSTETALQAKILELIGDIYSENNELQSAVNYYLRANSSYEALQDNHAAGGVLVDLASINLRISKYTKTRDYLIAAEKLYKKNPDVNTTELINCYFLLGVVYGNLEKLDSSLYYFNRCEKFYSRENNPIQYGGVLNNIGAIYSKMGNKNEALEKYNKALVVFQEIENKPGIGVTISNIAYLKQKYGFYQEAIRLFNESNSYLSEPNDAHYLLTNYSNLSDIYKELDDYKNAFYFQDKYLQIKDKIANEDVLTRISEVEKKHELTKKDNEYKLIEKEVELKSKTLWFTLSASALFIIVVLLVYRNARISLQKTRLKETLLEVEKKKLSDELQFKNKELEQFALAIIEKNDFLGRIKSGVKEIMKNPQDETRIKAFSAQLNQNLQLESDLKKFELQLDKNLKSFFHKLELHFPNLTKSEKRLASLLVLDLSTKDIASIFNISLDGVKKSRYRLRKKLNLETNEDLSLFLKNI